MNFSCQKFDFIHEKATVVDTGNCIIFQKQKREDLIIYHPVNLAEFDIDLKDGDTVVFRFISKDYITTCPTGITIDLLTLKK